MLAHHQSGLLNAAGFARVLGVDGKTVAACLDLLRARPSGGGGSWEGFAIETLIAASPEGTRADFYRTAAGAEIDLVLMLPGGRPLAVEVKRSLTPKVERGFHHACEDIGPERRFVVYPGEETCPLKDDIVTTSPQSSGRLLLNAG